MQGYQLSPNETVMATGIVAYLHRATDAQLGALLDRIRARFDEIQTSIESVDPGHANPADMAELGWGLLVNQEAVRRRVLLENLERDLAGL